MNRKQPKILVVGGGKGGVGKSFVSSSVAVALAQSGRKTVIVDLDLGGANLHTLFGIKNTDRGIGDYIFHPVSNDLLEYAVDTSIENLKLISGNGFIPGIANIEHQRKLKIIKALGQMDVDCAVLDLGAGTSYNVIDFFTITQSGVIVTMHEPTAILNAYEFLKNVIFRIYARECRSRDDVMKVINEYKTASESFAGDGRGTVESLMKAIGRISPADEQKLRRIHQEFRPAFIVNMSRTDARVFSRSLEEICENYLNVRINYLGAIPDDPLIQQSCLSMKPFLVHYATTQTAYLVRNMAMECAKANWMDASRAEQEKTIEPVHTLELTPPPEQASLSQLIRGRPETDLSSMLGAFFEETSNLIGAKVEAPVSAAEPEKGGVVESDGYSGLAVTFTTGLPAIYLPVQPRVRPDAMLPFFIPIVEKRGNIFTRYIARIKNPSEGAGGVLAAFEEIRNNPHAKDIAVSMKMLAEQSEPSEMVGREWIKTGLTLIQAHQVPLAQMAFQYSQLSLRQNEMAMNNLAASLIVMGNIGQALNLLKEGLKIHKHSPYLRFNVGLAYMALKQYKEAATCFGDVRKLIQSGHVLPADCLEGYCLYHQRNYQLCESVFRSIVEREPQDLYARFNWALSQIQSGLYEQALQSLTQLLDMMTQDAEVLACRGLVYWQCRQPEQAIADFSKAIHLAPGNISVYLARAALSQQAGRYDLAISDMQTITRLLPTNKTFQYLFEQIRSQIGNQPDSEPVSVPKGELA